MLSYHSYEMNYDRIVQTMHLSGHVIHTITAIACMCNRHVIQSENHVMHVMYTHCKKVK